MTPTAVETAVRERLGLEPAALGPSGLTRAVETRVRATRSPSVEAYLPLLLASAEANALAGELAIPETWFFRGGRRLFDGLADFLLRRSARTPGKPARALSIPCSTGEEPYSLAIALYERLAPPDAVRIDAVDVSAPHLERGTAGLYPDASFRESGINPRPTHFAPAADRWQLLPHLRQAVQFRQANVTDTSFLPGEPPYDLIICRNLFIYLTADGRKRAMAHLDRLLAPDGRLCLSAAEADRLPAGKFAHDGPNEFCVFVRASAATTSGVFPATQPASGGSGVKSGVFARPPIPLPPPTPVVPPPSVPLPAAPSSSFELARVLADAGKLPESRAACEQACAANPGSADGYPLLGAILLAEGNAVAAGNAFRKALYLAPDHPDALAHLLVLADRRGDADQADALRRRLARLSARGGSV
jgi:chemotaxis protein methyltransferase WspC